MLDTENLIIFFISSIEEKYPKIFYLIQHRFDELPTISIDSSFIKRLRTMENHY